MTNTLDGRKLTEEIDSGLNDSSDIYQFVILDQLGNLFTFLSLVPSLAKQK